MLYGKITKYYIELWKEVSLFVDVKRCKYTNVGCNNIVKYIEIDLN